MGSHQSNVFGHLGPQTFRPKDAPRYVPAEITIIVCLGICLCIMVFIRFWYGRENKRKAAIQARPDYVRLENQEYVSFLPFLSAVALMLTILAGGLT